MRPRPPLGPLLLGLLLAAGLTACAEPALPDGDAGEDVATPEEVVVPDPHHDRLVARTRELAATLTVARQQLEAVEDAGSVAAARDAAATALAALVDGEGDADVPLPVFPSTTSAERGGDGELDDALSAALTAAQEAGGALGRSVSDVLRDPLAGDLGAWQRDPEGVLAWVAEVADTAGDLEARQAAILELPGDGTRAIAWTRLAAAATDREAATAYASRAAAHLDLVLASLEEVLAGERADGADVEAPA